MATPLSHGKESALVIAARTSSVLSVLGSLFIISTFVYFPFFRKPINRLVFFATLGNIMTNVATWMSIAVLPKGSLPPSGLCQFQSLLVQWFMVADSFWVLCMATNVLLVFFHGYDAQQIRHLEKWYFAFSYGVSAVPAITYVILDHTGHQIIGSATLWCWVAIDAEWMRIAFFYAPAWIVITATLSIYLIIGYRIWKKRVELRSIFHNARQVAAIGTPNRASNSNVLPPFGTNIIFVTTQITQDTISRRTSVEPDQDSITSFSSTQMLAGAKQPATDAITGSPLPCYLAGIFRDRLEDTEGPHTLHHGRNKRSGYRAAVVAINISKEATEGPKTSSVPFSELKRTPEGHVAAMAYLQVAFLMFSALFVVWLPSSINRMYQFIYNDPSFALNLMSAIVLPLQGAWNAVIYIFTTRKECKRAWGMTMSKITRKPLRCQPQQSVFHNGTLTNLEETCDSTAEIVLEEFLEEDAYLRYSESSSADGGRRL